MKAIIKKYKVSIIFLFIFLLLTAATLFTRFSTNYVHADEMVQFLNSDLGRLGVEIEETANAMLGTNNDSTYREWSRELEQAEEELHHYQTICIVLASLSVVALIGGITNIVMTNKKWNRKEEETPARSVIQTPLSNADELKKFKDLLDNDVITQEEFDKKKKQLLGL